MVKQASELCVNFAVANEPFAKEEGLEAVKGAQKNVLETFLA